MSSYICGKAQEGGRTQKENRDGSVEGLWKDDRQKMTPYELCIIKRIFGLASPSLFLG